MRRTWFAMVCAIAALAGAGACQRADVRAVIYYNFSLLDASQPGQHYQHFADVNGGVADLGCFVVESRQLNCFDSSGTGQPNLRLAVVECACPCVAEEDDPCDATRPQVRLGTVRGLVNETQGPVQLGGVEMPTDVDLARAEDLFITTESNDDTSPAPSASVVLTGRLVPDGAVLRGSLASPTTRPVQGNVTILPVTDEASL
jgi:hypothetical protein